jgi:hypothetical protein
MTSDQIKLAIYQSFYSVVRIGVQPSQDVFFASTIVSTWPGTPPPTAWPTFWYDSVALEIQQSFMSFGKYLPGLDGGWLSANASKYKWNDVYLWANGTNPAIPGGILDYIPTPAATSATSATTTPV